MTADEERGIVYMTFGAPAANYYGGDRPGANLFGNSVVAVDAATGKYKWHFQVVHHDLWDYDLPPAPVLVDIVSKGKKIPALAQIGKSGWMFILNRVTGKPVFGVEERPVPKGDVPGEWYSPTQPFPLKPTGLTRTSMKREDLVTADDTTPEHAKACQELWDKNGLFNEGPFTPWAFHEEGAPPRITVSSPEPPAERVGVAWPPIQSPVTFSCRHTISPCSAGWRRSSRAAAMRTPIFPTIVLLRRVQASAPEVGRARSRPGPA